RGKATKGGASSVKHPLLKLFTNGLKATGGLYKTHSMSSPPLRCYRCVGEPSVCVESDPHSSVLRLENFYPATKHGVCYYRMLAFGNCGDDRETRSCME